MTARPERIDVEVHLLHPEACAADFLRGKDEPTRRAIHEHVDFPLVQPLLSLEALHRSMNEAGIDRSVIMGMAWRDAGAQRDNNRYVAEVSSHDPARFQALYIPHLGDPVQASREVEQLDTRVWSGVKLLPSDQGRTLDDPELTPLFQTIAARDLPLMVHTDHPTQSLDRDTPYRFLSFVRRYPTIRVLAPHLGGMICVYGLKAEIRSALRNVTFVTSVSATMQMVEFAAQVNPDNIVFGSDFPFNHCHSQREPLQELLSLRLSDETKARIAGGLAQEIFPGRGPR